MRWVVVVFALLIFAGIVVAPFFIDNNLAQALFGIITTAISTFVGVWASWNYSKNSDKERLTRYGLLAWRHINALSVKVEMQIQQGSVINETLKSWLLDIDDAKLAWKDLLRDVFELQERLMREKDEVVIEYKTKYKSIVDEEALDKLDTEIKHEFARIQNLAPLPIPVEKELNELRALAYVDPLTKLSNRRAFLDHATKLFANNIPYVIAIIDLDRFKTINDEFGHTRGDELLGVVANALKNNLRSSDFVARLGGDEFTAIFTGTTPDTVVKSLTTFIATLSKVIEKAGFPALTATCGVSSDRSEIAELKLKDAEDAMYYAKQEGRARVKLAD